jgi:hypothetical protein
MRIISRRIFLVLVAVCVMSVVGVASASAALPELVNKEGKALVKNKFSAKVSGDEKSFEVHTDYAGGMKVYCEQAAVVGGFSGLKAGETTFTLKTCRGGRLGGKCTGMEKGKEREQAGEIVAPFSLTLVYASKASKGLALLFKPQEGLTFVCQGQEFTLHGGFLVPIRQENVNKLLEVGKDLWLRAEYTESGGQEVKQYETEKGEKVETYLKVSQEGGEEVESAVYFGQEIGAVFEEGVEFKG